MRPRRAAIALGLALGAGAVIFAQAAADNGAVRVTAPRANVRAAADEKSAIVGSASAGQMLALKGVEGDWYHVEVTIGGVRVDAYISKKVASVVPPPPATPAAAPPPAPPPPPDPARDGLSVALEVHNSANWIFSVPATLHVLDAKADTLRGAADAVTADAKNSVAEGASPVTFVWTLPDPAAPRTIDDRRPTFVVTYKEVPGYSPENIVPALIRLAVAPSNARVVAAVRGRADQSTRPDADWDVLKDLKQDTVKATIAVLEPGAAQVTPAADLAPGDYAIVFRPSGKKKLAGVTVLKRGPEMRLFTDVWPFSIK